MRKSLFDHDRLKFDHGQLPRYRQLDLINSSERMHPATRVVLQQRKRTPDAVRVKQFVRIELGYRA